MMNGTTVVYVPSSEPQDVFLIRRNLLWVKDQSKTSGQLTESCLVPPSRCYKYMLGSFAGSECNWFCLDPVRFEKWWFFFTLQQLHWCETLINSAWFLINGLQSLGVLYNRGGFHLHFITVFVFLQENIDSLTQKVCLIWELASWILKEKWPLWLSQQICKNLSQGTGIQKLMSQAWSIVHHISEKKI